MNHRDVGDYTKVLCHALTKPALIEIALHHDEIFFLLSRGLHMHPAPIMPLDSMAVMADRRHALDTCNTTAPAHYQCR